jgi:hypothetical protein
LKSNALFVLLVITKKPRFKQSRERWFEQKDIPLCYSSIINRYYFFVGLVERSPHSSYFLILRHPSCIEIWKSVEVV